MVISISTLCRGIPEEIRKYLEYCRSLRFEDKPNYPYLLGLFREALEAQRYGDQALGLDWTKLKSREDADIDLGASGSAPAGDNAGDLEPPVDVGDE